MHLYYGQDLWMFETNEFSGVMYASAAFGDNSGRNLLVKSYQNKTFPRKCKINSSCRRIAERTWLERFLKNTEGNISSP